MKKIILTAISACAMASLLACSADYPASVDTQTQGPTGGMVTYGGDSVDKTNVDKPSTPSRVDYDDDDDEEDISDYCSGSYTSVDLDEDGIYYYCEKSEKIYCDLGDGITTKCDSDIIDLIDDEGLLY